MITIHKASLNKMLKHDFFASRPPSVSDIATSKISCYMAEWENSGLNVLSRGYIHCECGSIWVERHTLDGHLLEGSMSPRYLHSETRGRNWPTRNLVDISLTCPTSMLYIGSGGALRKCSTTSTPARGDLCSDVQMSPPMPCHILKERFFVRIASNFA